jgi:DNA/RNA-binding domain of Phe-tRNA-synthetase-like protein
MPESLVPAQIVSAQVVPAQIIQPEILERFAYRGLMLYVRGLENGPSDEASIAELRRAEAEVRAAFGDSKASDHPHLMAWREAFSGFGLKPSKFLNSSEALLSRVLKGGELPAINWLTDAYNAISVRHVLPCGGEDWDAAVGPQQLRFARGDEPFDTIKDGEGFVDHPQPGEVVWADDAGVTCRAWNWRQCVRTRLTEHTQNAYFVLDSLEPYSRDSLLAAADDLEVVLQRRSPGLEVERVRIGAWSLS